MLSVLNGFADDNLKQSYFYR